MERYSAVTEYRFEARIERDPSVELIVLCLTMGWRDEPDEAEVRAGLCSIETAMMRYKRCQACVCCC